MSKRSDSEFGQVPKTILAEDGQLAKAKVEIVTKTSGQVPKVPVPPKK